MVEIVLKSGIASKLTQTISRAQQISPQQISLIIILAMI
jgi:hypothetical protein